MKCKQCKTRELAVACEASHYLASQPYHYQYSPKMIHLLVHEMMAIINNGCNMTPAHMTYQLSGTFWPPPFPSDHANSSIRKWKKFFESYSGLLRKLVLPHFPVEMICEKIKKWYQKKAKSTLQNCYSSLRCVHNNKSLVTN